MVCANIFHFCPWAFPFYFLAALTFYRFDWRSFVVPVPFPLFLVHRFCSIRLTCSNRIIFDRKNSNFSCFLIQCGRKLRNASYGIVRSSLLCDVLVWALCFFPNDSSIGMAESYIDLILCSFNFRTNFIAHTEAMYIFVCLEICTKINDLLACHDWLER